MSRPALTQTTLSAALNASDRVFAIGSTTGVNPQGITTEGSILVIGSEAMLVQRVPVSGTVEVIRGFGGTKARAHASGVRVFVGARSTFGFQDGGPAPDMFGLVGLTGDPGSLPAYRLPVGVVVFNPDDGNEYRLVDCQASMAIGAWAVIDGNGLASALAATSKGRCGVIVETVGGSDTLSWALVAGTSSSVQFTSNVTTACYLKAGAAIADILDSDGGNIIWGATCTAAPSSANDLGTGYLDHPWVTGVEAAFSSIGE
ncbi:MAG TPA: hypothetical protein VEA16_16915 [Vicinamibacterales bacterium]|nr:hypothetical protein [Vicinamibacterales bacterium]